MQVNPKLLKNQFEKSFSTYSENAVVQQLMARKLIEELSKIRKEFPNILELGCGTGFLTKELIKKISFDKYLANDLVEKSKNILRK